MANIKTKRLFLSFNIPPDIKKSLEQHILALRLDQKAIKNVGPDTLHITLRFLGKSDLKTEELIKTELRKLAGKFGNVTFSSGKILAFPSQLRPRIIYLDCEQTDGRPVLEIYKKLQRSLSLAGIPPDPKLWQPHITLGRVKRSGTDWTKNFTLPQHEFTVKSFELMESCLFPEGPKHKIIESYEL